MATKGSGGELEKVLKFWIFWILGFLPLTQAIRSNVTDHNLEIRNYLKKLNRPYVKSIKFPNGNIIDCVPINLQPSFDDPLLKNHTIQMQPSSYPKGFFSKNSTHAKPLTQLWQTKGICPKGTIPIRRTREEDLLRADSIQSYGKKTPRTNASPHEYAIRRVNDGPFYGARADLNVWNPRVMDASEFSLAQIWVSAGDPRVDINTIEAGWQVYPALYGDDETHLFVYWTGDGYRNTGCYNLMCNGFVQTHEDIIVGTSISPVSSYNGRQYQMDLFIWKEHESSKWWLQVEDKRIGYWPTSLFTHLQDYATEVDWGGEVVNRVVGEVHTTTEMGSGHFSEEGYQKAAFLSNLRVVLESYSLITPYNIQTRVTNIGCYDLTSMLSYEGGEFFYFGGPGRNHNCG